MYPSHMDTQCQNLINIFMHFIGKGCSNDSYISSEIMILIKPTLVIPSMGNLISYCLHCIYVKPDDKKLKVNFSSDSPFYERNFVLNVASSQCDGTTRKTKRNLLGLRDFLFLFYLIYFILFYLFIIFFSILLGVQQVYYVKHAFKHICKIYFQVQTGIELDWSWV